MVIEFESYEIKVWEIWSVLKLQRPGRKTKPEAR
jgi:hypothetical protein